MRKGKCAPNFYHIILFCKKALTERIMVEHITKS